MPFPLAAKAALIIAPIAIAAGIAVYEANKQEINEALRELGEELGFRQRRHEQSWGASSGYRDHAADRHPEAGTRSWRRRRSSVESGAELDQLDGSSRRRRRITHEAGRTTGVEASEGLKRRGGDVAASAGIATAGAGLVVASPNVVDEYDDGAGDAPVPNPFEDHEHHPSDIAGAEEMLGLTNPHYDTPTRPRSPATPSTLEIHTPTSEEDPMEFDPLEIQSARSQGSTRTMSMWSEVEGVRTPGSGEDDQSTAERMSMISSWSNVSARDEDLAHH